VKLTEEPTVAELLAGCDVMAGGTTSARIVRLTGADTTEPTEFVTVTV